MPTTYYYKDKTATGRTIFKLFLDGVVVGEVASKKEAEAWYRAHAEAAA